MVAIKVTSADEQQGPRGDEAKNFVLAPPRGSRPVRRVREDPLPKTESVS